MIHDGIDNPVDKKESSLVQDGIRLKSSASDRFTPVLDHGFVRLVNVMGSDEAIVQAARVSYNRDDISKDGLSFQEGTSSIEKVTPERDIRLIRYLVKHDHGTPFEMAVFTFHIQCPIFIMRQWIRHRIASYNERSARYTEVDERFFVPLHFRSQSKKNKQSSEYNKDLDHHFLSKRVQEAYDHSYAIYTELLEKGVSREMARIVLPLGSYTAFYWTINARSLVNFLNLRMAKDAQEEISIYAKAIYSYFKLYLPVSCDAFHDKYSWFID